VSEPREATPDRLRDQFIELAERYETIAALDTTAKPTEQLMHTPPGSRVPPGMQEILDVDEHTRVITAVDDWAEFLAHVLADELDLAAPSPTTPGRLRLAGQNADHFTMLDEDDHGLMALAVQDDIYEHLNALRRLAGRSIRRVRTGHHCQDHACQGQYVSPLGASDDRHQDALECSKCGHQVPYAVWSRWPTARVQYVTIERASDLLGITNLNTVRSKARRGKWRRIGTAKDMRYHIEDIRRVMD